MLQYLIIEQQYTIVTWIYIDLAYNEMILQTPLMHLKMCLLQGQ